LPVLSSALGLSPLGSPNRTQRIDRGNPADGPGGEAGLEDLSIRPDGKTGRVNDAATCFPIGADFVGVLRDVETIADGKRCPGALDKFPNYAGPTIDRLIACLPSGNLV